MKKLKIACCCAVLAFIASDLSNVSDAQGMQPEFAQPQANENGGAFDFQASEGLGACEKVLTGDVLPNKDDLNKITKIFKKSLKNLVKQQPPKNIVEVLKDDVVKVIKKCINEQKIILNSENDIPELIKEYQLLVICAGYKLNYDVPSDLKVEIEKQLNTDFEITNIGTKVLEQWDAINDLGKFQFDPPVAVLISTNLKKMKLISSNLQKPIQKSIATGIWNYLHAQNYI